MILVLPVIVICGLASIYLYKNDGNFYTGGYGTGNNSQNTYTLQDAYNQLDIYRPTIQNRGDYNQTMFEQINQICYSYNLDTYAKNQILKKYNITPVETIIGTFP